MLNKNTAANEWKRRSFWLLETLSLHLCKKTSQKCKVEAWGTELRGGKHQLKKGEDAENENREIRGGSFPELRKQLTPEFV